MVASHSAEVTSKWKDLTMESDSSSFPLVKEYQFPSGFVVKFKCHKCLSRNEPNPSICFDGNLPLPDCPQDTCLVPATSLAMNNLVVPARHQQYEDTQWFESMTSEKLYKGYRLPMNQTLTFNCTANHIPEGSLVAHCQGGPMDLPLCKPIRCFVSDEQLIESNVFLSPTYKRYHTKQLQDRGDATMGYSFPVNFKVTFTCSETYEEVGPMVTLCHSHGLIELPICMPSEETERKPCFLHDKDLAKNYLFVPEIYDDYFIGNKFEFPGKTVVVFECIPGFHTRMSLTVSCHHGHMNLPTCGLPHEEDGQISTEPPDFGGQSKDSEEDRRPRDNCKVMEQQMDSNNLVLPAMYYSLQANKPKRDILVPEDELISFQCLPGHIPNKPLHAVCSQGYMELPHC
uniref:Uncharacterized protein n=1 Tax=Eptatretus burgeri TaxID=7764 RepID=A0A8C4NID0_EPTBU